MTTNLKENGIWWSLWQRQAVMLFVGDEEGAKWGLDYSAAPPEIDLAHDIDALKRGVWNPVADNAGDYPCHETPEQLSRDYNEHMHALENGEENILLVKNGEFVGEPNDYARDAFRIADGPLPDWVARGIQSGDAD